METSDSDYFESADEDFNTDEETTAESRGKSVEKLSDATRSVARQIRQVNEESALNAPPNARTKGAQPKEGGDSSADIKRASVSKSEVENRDKKPSRQSASCEEGAGNDNTQRQLHVKKVTTLGANAKNQEAATETTEFDTESHENINDIWDNNSWDDVETTNTGKQATKASSAGKTEKSAIVKVAKTKSETEENMWDDDNEWNEIETMIKNESKSVTKKPGVNSPPSRVACWGPGANTSKILPAKVDCWEEGINTVTNFNKEVAKQPGDNRFSKTQDVRLTGYSEPPARVGCWEEDVNVVKSASTKSGPQVQAASFGTIGDAKKKKAETALKDEENMWEGDEWEAFETDMQQSSDVQDQSAPKEDASAWSGWGNWGISSVISTASTLTSHVSQGLSNVLETGIGIPDPEELARINKLEKEKLRETQPEEPPESKPKLAFGLGSFVHGVTKLVETTGNKVITGGLDTLETIGKKTMEVLQENDPGLKKKRAFLKIDDDKPILSQVLRDAKEMAERENEKLEAKHFVKKANYETLFDDHQGLVHLEALEMLSRQCNIKLQGLLEVSAGNALTEIQETMDQVKELCELPDEDDDESVSSSDVKDKLELAVSEINVSISYSRLVTLWDEVEDWLNGVNLNVCNEKELHQQAIETLAQLTAIAVEQFHKCGELLLVKDRRSTADEADALVQLTTTLTALIGIAAAKFSEKLNAIVTNGGNKETINELITNVFFEAANSSSYIQDAFQLLIPVLQVGAV